MSTQTQTADLIERLEKFLSRYYREDVLELANTDPGGSLSVDWMDLYQFDADLAEDLLDEPEHVLDRLEVALHRFDLPVDVDLGGAHVRVENASDRPLSIDQTRAEHIGTYVAINGQVAKTSAIKPRLVEAGFECLPCGSLTRIPQSGDRLQEPHECAACEKKGPFRLKPDESEYVDHQVVRLQEPPERTKGGDGEHVDVHLEDDLTGAVHPGDRADLSGIFRVSSPSGRKKSRTLDVLLEGRAAEVQQTDFEEIDVDEHLEAIEAIAAGERGDPFELLVGSIAPKIHGHETIKEAIALQMFGGWRHEYPDGTVDRGDSHILLIGDPGSAKSSLLRSVEDLAPRSVFASGKGMTEAGATAAAVRDDFGETEWSLEAGVLVLADKGIACIDELDKVSDGAVSSLHDALESQRVSVSKAGINATLPAQTALLAAGNPVYGRFDAYKPIAEQFDLAPTLISRFDLIFTVTDEPDEQRDHEIAEHIVRSRQTAGRLERGLDVDDVDREAIEPEISREVLRAYVAHAKQTVFPTIESRDIERSLVEFFTNLRSAYGDEDDSPVPVTYRKLEAIQRLAEASARARLSSTIDEEDIRRATKLVSETMRDVGIDPETKRFDADVIETGRSKTQRDRIRSIRGLLEDLENEHGGPVPIDDVVDRAADLGMDSERVEYEIESMKQRGEAYEPRNGRLAST